MKTGIELIATKRKRVIEGCSYIRAVDLLSEAHQAQPAAFRVRNLVKAGALIAAEIDRLQRKEKSP